MWPSVGFFFFFLSSPRQCQLYPDRYLSWAHTARCSGGNRVCAVLRIPSCLLPSDSSSLAGASAPSVQCSQYKWYCEEAARAVHPHMNGRVGEFPLWLARLLRAPVCSQASLVCCVSGGTGWSSGIVIWLLSGCLFIDECLFLVYYTETEALILGLKRSICWENINQQPIWLKTWIVSVGFFFCFSIKSSLTGASQMWRSAASM